MEREKAKPMGIIETTSQRVGVCVGTAARVGEKIAGIGGRGVASVRRLLRPSPKEPALLTDQETGPALTASAFELKAQASTARQNAPEAQVGVPEPHSTSAQRELEQVRGEAERPVSQLVRQLTEAEKDSVVPRVEETPSMTDRTTGQEGKGQDAGAQLFSASGAVCPDEAIADQQAEERRAPIAQADAMSLPDVLLAEVCAAVFPTVGEKVTLVKALAGMVSQNPSVRADAAGAMAGIRHELSVRALVSWVAREPSPQVRLKCVKALTTLGMKEGLPAVERALTDEAASVRLAAAWGVYGLAGVHGACALTRMLSDENEEIRRRVATCIGWLGEQQLAPSLVPLLADRSVSVRRAAVEAIRVLRSRQAVSALIEHLNDPDELTRRAVLGAIEQITGKTMNEPFSGNEKSQERLLERWRQWWKEEHLE